MKKENEHLVPEMIKDIAKKAIDESKNSSRVSYVRLQTISDYIDDVLTKIDEKNISDFVNKKGGGR